MKKQNKNLIILAIETSCDETSAAIIKVNNSVLEVASNIISSQIDIHKKYGGVVPEVAARHHVQNIIPVIMESLETASVTFNDIDLIAVTSGPGLITSLMVGVETAKSLGLAWNKPVIQVNHMYAHLAANFLYFNLPQTPSFRQGGGKDQQTPSFKPGGGSDQFPVMPQTPSFKQGGESEQFPVMPQTPSFKQGGGKDQQTPSFKQGGGSDQFPVMPQTPSFKQGGESEQFPVMPQTPSFRQGWESDQFPIMALIVSGGHTELVLVEDYNKFKKIGQTVDDAAGEAFDKVAKLLGLGYPGGPAVSSMAEKFSSHFQGGVRGGLPGSRQPLRPHGAPPLSKGRINFPRPMINSGDFNFSFSGLKTAVLYATQKMTKPELKERTPEICYEFQEAVADVLVKKTIKAAEKFSAKTVFMAGGVAANKKLRQELESAVKNQSAGRRLEFFVPPFQYCTDNAAMIGIAAYYLSQEKMPAMDNWQSIKADPNWELT